MNLAIKGGAIMATFKERFLYLKTEKNLTLEEIAEAVHTNKASLSRIVNGTLSLKYEMIDSLANYFDVDIAYLIGESDIRKNKEKIPPLFREVFDYAIGEEIPPDALWDFVKQFWKYRKK